MTHKDFLIEVCGEQEMETYARVKGQTMRLARVVKQMIAEDLDGTIPSRGKQFVTTSVGTYRVALGDNSDNSTEEGAHEKMRAETVFVFPGLKDGLSLETLYSLHGYSLDRAVFLAEVKEALRGPEKT